MLGENISQGIASSFPLSPTSVSPAVHYYAGQPLFEKAYLTPPRPLYTVPPSAPPPAIISLPTSLPPPLLPLNPAGNVSGDKGCPGLVLIQQQATGGEGAATSFYSAQQARAMEMTPYLEQTFAVQAADPPPLPPQENGGRGLRAASHWLMRGKGGKGEDNAGGRDLQQFGGMGMMMFGDTGSGDGGIGRLPWAWIWAWSCCCWGMIWMILI